MSSEINPKQSSLFFFFEGLQSYITVFASLRFTAKQRKNKNKKKPTPNPHKNKPEILQQQLWFTPPELWHSELPSQTPSPSESRKRQHTNSAVSKPPGNLPVSNLQMSLSRI